MIDFEREHVLTLAQAAKRLPGSPNPTTLYRWVVSGHLDSIRVGRKLFTSAEAVRRFVSACNSDSENIESATRA